MDWLAVGKAISDLGGWAAFLALVVVIGVSGAKRKPLWVWGWIFERSEKRAESSDTQAERNAESLTAAARSHADTAKAVSDLAESFKVMARSYDRIDVRLEALERRGVKDG